MGSKFKTIKNFEAYLIYSDGRVWSIKKQIFRTPVLYNNGYYCLMLKSKGKRQTFLIHRLVALAFIPNPDNKTTVNHKDGNKLNNNVENLEWMSLRENIQHGYKTGLLKVPKIKHGEEHGASKFKQSEVDKIRELRKQGETLWGIANKYGSSAGVIGNIVNYKTWKN